ncbi:MAG: hypothetical protein IPO98_05195 [Saprospiraceae bacterium]|nr:hypothetical protein [Saprospiraceae bacterium]
MNRATTCCSECYTCFRTGRGPSFEVVTIGLLTFCSTVVEDDAVHHWMK